ncbi:MAG TPA: AAA family ATPase [Candidatus Tectomicrobia bacterium]
MTETRSWRFGPFHLDVGAARLWHGSEAVRLTAKTWGVLHYLVAHAGQLVSKENLYAAVWDAATVSDAALAACIRELRQALGDTAQTSQYVETVRGRGYRFVAPVTAAVAALWVSGGEPSHQPVAVPRPGLVVGREAELRTLQQCWVWVQQGLRQVVMVTGEAGIGKTTLVDAFVAHVGAIDTHWLTRGQCIEQHGAGEAYLPLLEALGRLGRGPNGAHLVQVLHQHAPSWLVHLPALVPPEALAALARRAGGATQERMLRELAEAVEVLTVARPLVLVLEDLHWCDVSTLDWVAAVAQRREAARLLVLGTYRPVDALVQGHGLHTVVQDLRLHGQAMEVVMSPWCTAEVALYLTQRFGTRALSVGLADVLHQRTDGNPFFLVAVMDALVQQGMVRQSPQGWVLEGGLEAVGHSIPESLRQLIEQQFTRLSLAEQTVLEAASVAGTEFSAAVLAVAVDKTVDAVEAQCLALARRGQFVEMRGANEWPDGTVAERYGFLHTLHQEIIYAQTPVHRRLRWHQQIGTRLEVGYGPQARALAVELAEHFVRGRDTARAVQYLQYAGEQAAQRSAYQEALRHLTQGLTLLATLPDTPARVQQELDLQLALGPALMSAKGLAAPEVEQTYVRAHVLCHQLGETPQLVPTLRGLCEFYRNRGALPMARELGTQLFRIAQRAATPTLRLEAHEALGATVFFLGEYATAWTHYAQGIARIDPAAQRTLALHHGVAPGVRCLAQAALVLWCQGYPAQAVQRSREALILAQGLAHPYSLAVAQFWAAALHHCRREATAVQTHAEALLTLATTQGFPLWIGHGACWNGWALAMQRQDTVGLAQMHQGLAAVVAVGQTLTQPLSLLLLAEVAEHTDQMEKGLALLAEALTVLEERGQGDLLAEVYRLQGEFRVRQAVSDPAQAEACFQQALNIARQQQAKSWELRAALSLARLWQQQGKHAEARELLAPIYGWFTEGFDTVDLQDAKALLEELGD